MSGENREEGQDSQRAVEPENNTKIISISENISLLYSQILKVLTNHLHKEIENNFEYINISSNT